MWVKVLVAYATKYGATAGIAERIALVLREAGIETDVLPVHDVLDVSSYGAVVLGSAVYIGKWRGEAAKFLKKNESVLATRPIYLFSSGPTEEGDPVELLKGWCFPAGLQEVADRIGALEIVVFHGAVFPDKLNFMERWILKKVKAPFGDFRDWEAISSWAETISHALKEREASPESRPE